MQLRFDTDQALFEAFPSAREHVKTEPTGLHSLVFLKTLASQNRIEDAIGFCAYLLPRREAVAWGCRSVRTTWEDLGRAGDGTALRAAEAWVAAPDEPRRLAAHERWREADRNDPAVWLALGAAWSGGPLSPQNPNSKPAPAHFTAKAVRVALVLTLHALRDPQKSAHARIWIADGLRLAESGI